MKKRILLKSFLSSLSFLLSLLLILNIITPIAYSYPKPIGYVNDFANTIDADYEQKITQLIADIQKNTSAEIAVVTIESLEGDSIEYYAVKLFEEWGIGKKEQDNGLLILVALKDRKYRIEVGYGLEGAINDAKAGRIARAHLTPNFKYGDYGKGIYETIQALKPHIIGEPIEPEVSKVNIFGFFGLIAFSIAYGITLFLYLIKINKIKEKKEKKKKRLLMALPWIIPFLPLMILLFLLSLMLFITTLFVYIAFASYLFSPKMPRQRHLGPFGGFGGGIGGFRGGGGSGGGFGGFGGGGSGGGGASGGW